MKRISLLLMIIIIYPGIPLFCEKGGDYVCPEEVKTTKSESIVVPVGASIGSIRFYDASHLEVEWKRKTYGIVLGLESYEELVPNSEGNIYIMSFNGIQKKNINGDYDSENDFNFELTDIDYEKLPQPPPDPDNFDYYNKDYLSLDNNKYYLRVAQKRFPTIDGDLRIYRGTIKITTIFYYEVFDASTGVKTTRKYVVGDPFESEVFIFNERPAKPKNIHYTSDNTVYDGVISGDSNNPVWLGPHDWLRAGEAKFTWETDLRLRGQEFKYVKIKNGTESTISRYFTADNDDNQYDMTPDNTLPPAIIAKLLLGEYLEPIVGKLTSNDYPLRKSVQIIGLLDENSQSINKRFDNGKNVILLGARDSSYNDHEVITKSSSFPVYYDKNDPAFQADELTECTKNLYSDFSYTFSWPPAHDENSGVHSYKWGVAIGDNVVDEWSDLINHDGNLFSYSGTRAMTYDPLCPGCLNDLDRNTQYKFYIQIKDKVNNSDEPHIAELDFETPAERMSVEDIIPLDVVKESENPVYTAEVVMDVIPYEKDGEGNPLFEQYFDEEIVKITMVREIDMDGDGAFDLANTRDFSHYDIFPLQPDGIWQVKDKKFTFKDTLTGPEYAHTRPHYRITTLFGIDPNDDDIIEVSARAPVIPLKNYFPAAEVVVNREGEAICRYFTKNLPGIMPGDSMLIGRNTSFLFTSDELTGGADIEGDILTASVYRLDQGGAIIAGPIFLPFDTPVQSPGLFGDVSGEARIFIQFDDDEGNETANTETVSFTYDADNPAKPFFTVYALDRENVVLGTDYGTKLNVVKIDGLEALDVQTPDAASGVEKLIFWNYRENQPIDQDLSNFYGITPGLISIDGGYRTLDMTGPSIPWDIADQVAAGSMGILIDIEELNEQTEPDILPVTNGLVPLAIIWKFTPAPAAPLDEPFTICMKAIDGAGNRSTMSGKTFNLDTIPPEPPSGYYVYTDFQENVSGGPFGDMQIEITGPPGANSEPIPLADFNGDAVKYYYNFEFVDTPAIPPQPDMTVWSDSLPCQAVTTENLNITIPVTAQSEWDKCIKMALWAEDEAGNVSSFALYDNHIFSAALPSSALVQTNRENDLDANNHIYFKLLPSSDDISHNQKLVYMESIDPPIPSGVEIYPDGDGYFNFDNSGQGCTGHREYGFQIIALNQDNDSRPGDIFAFTPPNHDITPSSGETMIPSTYLNTENNFSFKWTPFSDVDGNDTIHYRVYCRKTGEPGFTLLTAMEGIPDSELYRDTGFVTTELLNGTETDGDEYEWYIEAYDTYMEKGVEYTGNTVRLPETTGFRIDNTNPDISIVYTPGTFMNAHALPVSIIEETSEPVLTYADNTVQYGPVNTGDLTFTGEGVYSYVLTLQEDGVRTVNAMVTDSAGNTDTDSALVNVDTAPPETGALFINLPIMNNIYVCTTGKIGIGGLRDAFAGVKDISLRFRDINGQVVYEKTGIQVSYAPGDTGEKAIEVILDGDIAKINGVAGFITINDWAGNSVDWTTPCLVAVDVTNPKITAFTTDGLERYMSSLLSISCSVTAEDPEAAVESIQFAIGDAEGNPVSGWEDTWSILQGNYTNQATGYTTLDQGIFTILVEAVTVYGLSAQTISDPFIVDTTPPELSVSVIPAGDVPPGQTVRVKAEASDPESAISVYTCGLGSTPGTLDISGEMTGNIGGWFYETGGNGSFTLTLPGSLIDGTCYVSVRTVNGAGVTASNEGTELQVVVSGQEAILVKDNGEYTSDPTCLKSRWEYSGSREISCYLYDVLDENDAIITAGNSGILAEAEVTNLELADGSTYRFRVTGCFTDTTSLTGESVGIKVDTSPPEFYTTETEQELVYSAATRSDRIPIGWNGRDNESGIHKQELLVEKYDENSELVEVAGGWIEIAGDNTYITGDINGDPLDLLTGDRIYITIRLTNGAGLIQERMTSLIKIDNTAPPVPFVMDNGVIVNTESAPDAWATWKWSEADPESGTSNYLWTITQVKSEVGLDGWISQVDDETVMLTEHPDFAGMTPGMLHGQSFYVAVKAVNGAGTESGTGFSDGITFDMTAPLITEVKLLAQGMLPEDDDREYISLENVSDGLVLFVAAHEDIAGNIASYTGGYEKREDGLWTVDPYTVLKTVTPEDPDGLMPLTGLTLGPGILCRFSGSSRNAADMESARGYTGGVIFDNTVPDLADIHVFALGDSFHFDWRISETETITPITSCKIAFVPAGDAALEEDFIENPFGFESYIQDTTGLVHGAYRLCIRVSDAAGNIVVVYTDPVIHDQTPPVLSFAQPEGHDAYISKTLDFNVNIEEDLSVIREYQYSLGSFENPGILTGGYMGEFMGLGTGINRIERTFCFPGYEGETGNGKIQLSGALADREELFLTVRAKNGQGKWSMELKSQVIEADLTPPTTPIVVVPEYTGYANRIEFDRDAFHSEDTESGVTHFRLAMVGDIEDPLAVKAALENAAIQAIGQFPDYAQFPGCEHETTGWIVVQTLNGAKDWSLPGSSNMFTVDLMPPGIALVTPEEEIIVNGVPYEVMYTVDEYAEITFTLFDGNNVLVSVVPVTCGGAGTYNYTFTVPGDAYDTYTLKVTEARDIVGNIISNLTLASIRLNAPPVIVFGEMETFPGRNFTLNAVVYDPDNDGISSFQWFVKQEGDYVPLSGLMPYGASGAAFDSVFTHHAITDQRTEYEVRLDVNDLEDKETSAGTIAVVVNTRYGALCMDEVWSGEHRITGNITVPQGITLTVDGALVKAKNTYGYEDIYIDVKGTIAVKNYSEFKLDAEAAYDYWTGIYISGDGTVENSRIQDARFGITAQPGSDVSIQNTIFESNEIGVRAHGCVPLIEQCTFKDNIVYGIKEDAGAAPVVRGCLFTGNMYDYYDDAGKVLKPQDINDIQEDNYDNEAL